MSGGIVGVVQGHLAMSDNINLGDVSMSDATGDLYAGGIVGAFNMHGTSGAVGSTLIQKDTIFGEASDYDK